MMMMEEDTRLFLYRASVTKLGIILTVLGYFWRVHVLLSKKMNLTHTYWHSFTSQTFCLYFDRLITFTLVVYAPLILKEIINGLNKVAAIKNALFHLPRHARLLIYPSYMSLRI